MMKSPVHGERWRRTIDEAHIVELLILRGWPIELRNGRREEAVRQARSALDRLVALGLAYGESELGERLFDPVEVSNFVVWAGCNLGDPTFEQRFIATMRRLIWQSHGADGEEDPPPPPASIQAGRYAVTIRRTFKLEDHRTGDRVRLRLPVPLEGPGLSDLRIEFLPPKDLDVEVSVREARLDFVVPVPPGGEITAGIRASFTAWPGPRAGQPGTLDPAEAELYTRPTEGLISLTERIGALARRLAGEAEDPRAILRRFWTFMMNDFACGTIHYDRLDPARPLETVLEDGWYDCRTGSALLAALCRARGIPARIVNGYTLHVPAPGLHTWLEAWVDGAGWWPMDLVCWGLTTRRESEGAWRDYYFGEVDHRMALERPPRQFGGTGKVRLPHRWHLLNFAEKGGATAEFRAIETGALVYREHAEVERLDRSASLSGPE